MANGLPDWIDVSNYSKPFTADQQAFIQDNMIGVCIGLQNAAKATAFKAQVQALGTPWDCYVDKPGRDISICLPGLPNWIDVEPGCFELEADVDAEIARIAAAGQLPGIYGNKTSIQAVIGESTKWSHLPLWYANYPNDHHVPTLAEFVPFNGWTQPEGWQYSSLGIAGINCDLDVELWTPAPPAPPTPDRKVVGVGIAYDDGTQQQVWP